MRRFVPRLADGQEAKISFALSVFRYLNHIYWPPESDIGYWIYMDQFLAILVCFLFVQHNDAELRYFLVAGTNIDVVLSGVPTYIIVTEAFLRVLDVLYRRHHLLELMQQFYTTIYVDRKQHPELFDRIQVEMAPSRVVAVLYLSVLVGFMMIPILDLIYQRQNFLYAMIYPFDTTPIWVFVPLLMSNIWLAYLTTTMIFGETNLIGEFVMHLNARYILLQRDLNRCAALTLIESRPEIVASRMKSELKEIFRRNLELHKFSEQVEAQFNLRIFIMFSFSALLLCALCFKTFTNPMVYYTFGLWFLAKTAELLVLGQLGSKLAYTTDDISKMYYESNWEDIIYQSSDVRRNVQLLKLIALAIEINSKPFYLTGFKYFRISLSTVIMILKGAFSYYMFLTSIR